MENSKYLHRRNKILRLRSKDAAVARFQRRGKADLKRRFKISQRTIWRLVGKVAPAKPRLDADTERAARAFMRRLEGKYPVSKAIVFGSRARGTHQADSDADVAVFLKGPPGNRVEIGLDMAGIAVDVLQETGILVEALPLWDDELKSPDTFSNLALLDNIRKDGLRL